LDYKGQDASDLIYEYLAKDEPCMIARFGGIEMSCVMNFHFLRKKNLINLVRFALGEDIYFKYEEKIVNDMCFSGFFPLTEEFLYKFYELMLECIPNLDILGSFHQHYESCFRNYMPNAKIIDLFDIEPYYYSNPWSRILKGKTVLVIHPFAESIRSQYNNREKLFIDQNVLPEFKLKTIKAVQSIANTNCGFKTWFDAFESMKLQIQKTEFDIAIIGCGAYGFPLASFVKDLGKKAVHLAGATQILFGIKGARWDDREVGKKLYNEYWVRPSIEETPQNSKNVENGCYW